MRPRRTTCSCRRHASGSSTTSRTPICSPCCATRSIGRSRAFLHLIRDGREPIRDFAKALEQEDQRMRDGYAPIWAYKGMGFYHAQLKRYFDAFDRQQLHVYLYEDLKNPVALSQQMFRRSAWTIRSCRIPPGVTTFRSCRAAGNSTGSADLAARQRRAVARPARGVSSARCTNSTASGPSAHPRSGAHSFPSFETTSCEPRISLGAICRRG